VIYGKKISLAPAARGWRQLAALGENALPRLEIDPACTVHQGTVMENGSAHPKTSRPIVISGSNSGRDTSIRGDGDSNG
jgi:hypothetical protein